MRQRHNPNFSGLFKGLRLKRKRMGNKVEAMPYRPKMTLTKNLFKFLEKATILTQLQNDIVKERLEECTEKTSPTYIARLCALLEKPIGGKE